MNPFRYRGYYYDAETGFYYLQSRYYNPAWGRFLNADAYISSTGTLIGFNMYTYCENDPINYYDPNGECKKFLGFLWKVDCKTVTCPTSKFYLSSAICIGSYGDGKGNVYVISESDEENVGKKTEKNAVIIIDKRSYENANMKILRSHKIKDDLLQDEIAQLMLDYADANPGAYTWERTKDSLLREWSIHNFAYAIFFKRDRAADCDFDNADEGKYLFDYISEHLFKLGGK